MIYCFDTSAINALCDDQQQSKVISILASHRTLISCVNIAEVVGTSDASRRYLLLSLLKRMSNGTNPLMMPNKLIRRATRAFAKGKKSLTVTISQEDAQFWWIVDDPTSASHVEQTQALEWKKSLEKPFIEAHREARPAFQSLYSQAETPPLSVLAQREMEKRRSPLV